MLRSARAPRSPAIVVLVAAGCLAAIAGVVQGWGTDLAWLPPGECQSPHLIEVVGVEYHWTFQLPGPDGLLHTADDPPVSRELILPPDRSVQLHLSSQDYVYALLLPALDLKQICVPGMTHVLEFRTPTAGEFEMPMGAFCGVSFLADDSMGVLRIASTSSVRRNLGCRH